LVSAHSASGRGGKTDTGGSSVAGPVAASMTIPAAGR
jgi:hypothetical protein